MQPVLSICFTTYNPGLGFTDQISEYLKSKNNKFKIIISDNKSTDGTYEILSKIKDERLILSQNKENLGGYKNFINLLKMVQGKYFMTMTDKDRLDFSHFDEIIDFFENNEFAVCRFLFNVKKDKKLSVRKYKSRRKALLNFCFRGNHPSGFVFNTSLFKKYNAGDFLENSDLVTLSYATDFITVRLFEKGEIAAISIPFLCFILPPFNNNQKCSQTYNINNLYFCPEYQSKLYLIYFDHLKNMNLTKYEMFYLKMKLLCRLYKYIVFYYKDILKNKDKMNWYNIPAEFIENENKKSMPKVAENLIFNNNTPLSEFETVCLKILLFLKYGFKRAINGIN